MRVMIRWFRRLGAAGLTLTLAGCGSLAAQPQPLSVGLPAAFPGVAGLSLRAVSPELEGYVAHLAVSPSGVLETEALWSNVPDAASLLSWQPGTAHVQVSPYAAVGAAALNAAGRPAAAGRVGSKNFLEDAQGRQTWSAPSELAPAAVAGGPAAVFAAVPLAAGGWELAEMRGGRVSLAPLPQVKGRIVAVQPGPEDGVWLAEDDPDAVMLWQNGAVQKQVPLTGTVMDLAPPRFAGAGGAVMALVSGPGSFPETADSLVRITPSQTIATSLAGSWLVPPDVQHYAGGVSRADWVSAQVALVTLWDSGLNQVSVARVNLATGAMAILPRSNFSPALLNGQPPVFPLTQTPAGVVVVGQGYGLAFYIPTRASWSQFIKSSPVS